MAVRFNPGTPTIESRPKKTRQGRSVNTILALQVVTKKRKSIVDRVDDVKHKISYRTY